MGEYSALVCSNSLKFDDALFLLFERGKSMQSCPCREGQHDCNLRIKIDQIQQFISESKLKGICEIANDNAEGQTIVSGDVESINTLQAFSKIIKKNLFL